MDEDEVLGKITKLLEKGCTMLATHHDCGAPLFRCQGEVVCPVCSFPDKLSSLDGEGLPERPVTKEAVIEAREDVEFMRAKANLRATLLRRLADLTACLEVEQDLDRLKKQLDCIEGLLRAFRSMQG
jgi:UPF0148 protein